MSIKIKRGLAINLPALEEGELGFTTDSYEMYVGSDNGNILLNNGEILIRRNNGMLQYAQSNRKNQWFDICSLEEIRGDQGIQGIQGIQGVKGDKGDKGERGIQGEKGNPFTYADFTPDQLRALKGEKGDTGAKGERGLTGDKGDRGVGLNYTWSGTRLGVKRDTDAQYTYVDLRGADGKDGKQGERGERGIQGEKGDTPSIAHLEQQVSDKSKELDTKFNALTAKQQQDAEVVTARDGEVSLHARLERDLAKGKIHLIDVKGSNVSVDSEEGYLENVEIHGNTWQNAENLADIRSVGIKVEGQELYKIDVVSTGKNLFNGSISNKTDTSFDFSVPVHICEGEYRISFTSNVSYSRNSVYLKSVNPSYNRFLGMVTNYNGRVSGNLTINTDDMNTIKSSTKGLRFSIYRGDGISDIPTDILITQSDDLSYEPYQEDKLTILSPTPLEKVGDVADRLYYDKEENAWCVEKNVNTSKIKVSSLQKVTEQCFDNTDYYRTNVLDSVFSSSQKAICNQFSTLNNLWSIDNLEGVNVLGTNQTHRLRLRIFKNSNINEFTIKYTIANPQKIILPHDQQVKLRTFADRTHISFETEIQPTIKASVPKSLGATVNTHTTQIDNLNKELDRVKKLEESTVSTVTTDSSFTTVSETTQGYFEDVKLEGKTLVNLAQSDNLYYKRGINGIGLGIDLTPTIESGLDVRPNRCCYKINVKPNTSYTFITCGNTIYDNYSIVQTSNNIVVSPVAVWKKFDLFTPSPTVDTIYVHLKVDSNDSDFTSIDQLKDHLIILEGDHTDKDLSYFEGLKSVGQDSDEISVSSVNENLIPTPTYRLDISSGSSTNNYPNTIICKNIPIKPNTTYRVSYGEYINKGNILGYPLRCMTFRDKYDGDNVHVNAYTHKNRIKEYSAQTFTTEADAKYLVITIGSFTSVGNIEITKLCLTESSVEKPYTPHKSNKKQILYYNPTTQTWEKPVLREWDSIEKHSNGKYYYHKRSGEVVLDGSESWVGNYSFANTGRWSYTPSNVKEGSLLICDRFINKSNDNTGEESIFTKSFALLLTLNNDKGSIKTWLQANNVTVVYQLAQEEVYECTNLDLITYNGETNLIVNSGAIQPRIALKVLSNVSNVVKLLQEKVSVLENKFIEGLKRVLAGDMMSLAHLLYPEDFTLENDTPQVIPYIEEGDMNE